MKSLISGFLLLSTGGSHALQPCHLKTTNRPMESKTQLHVCSPAFWGSTASLFAGFVMFGQVATASIPAADSYNMMQQPTSFTIAVRDADIVDFSMPSYEESSKGAAVVIKKDSPPTFNPFGDFQPDFKKSSDTTKNPPSETVVPDFKVPEVSVPEFKAPEMPKFSMPTIDMPKMDMPKVEFDSSKLDMPKFDMPKFDMPKFDMQKLDMPKLDMPTMDMPKLDMPKMDMPKLDMPKFEMSSIEMPKVELPSLSLPSIGFFGGTDSTSSEPKVYLPQEVRDEAARAARNVYLDADEFAKEIEAKAREAREAAKAKLELAKEAKDIACETRPGGKWICLRNPFVTGY